MKSPCTAYQKVKQLNEDESIILKILCGDIETGLRSSDLQEEVDKERKSMGKKLMDKMTFHKRLQRLNEELDIIERVSYTPGQSKDRREVYYRVNPKCETYCRELVTGFEVRQFIEKLELQSIVCEEEDASCIQRKIDIGEKNPIGISLFSGGGLDPTPVSASFNEGRIRKDLRKVADKLFHSIIEGTKDKNDVRIALVFHYPYNEVLEE